jgi:transcriptional regulator with XRE-family HTH domain
VDSSQKEKLSDFIRRTRNENGLSTADVEQKSGYTVTDGYVSHIENGRVKNVSPEKLKALAKGLGVSEEVIFAVARGKTVSEGLELEEMRALDFFRKLPDELKEIALGFLELLFNIQGKKSPQRLGKKIKGSLVEGALPEQQGINTSRRKSKHK